MSTTILRRPVSSELKNKILAAAVCGILAGAALEVHPVNAQEARVLNYEKHVCQSLNACRGQGGCKSDPNGCPGQNSCRGKGRCASSEYYHACKGKNNCKGQGGCNAEKAGRNSCKGKGGCAVPRKVKAAPVLDEKTRHGCGKHD